jgi:ethanolamine kinase
LEGGETEVLIARIPTLDVTIDHADLFNGALRVILTVFTEWREEDVELTQCKDGITNKRTSNKEG